jgi:transcriptional regulator with XRE-family HTH domain
MKQETESRFGAYFQELRKARRITLRDFCKKAQADPGNISKMERGILQPPQHDILLRYAEALGVNEGSEEWYRLTDLAAVDRGVVPKDLMSEKEVVEALPAFFRTLRGQKPTEEELVSLVEKIRSS